MPTTGSTGWASTQILTPRWTAQRRTSNRSTTTATSAARTASRASSAPTCTRMHPRTRESQGPQAVDHVPTSLRTIADNRRLDSRADYRYYWDTWGMKRPHAGGSATTATSRENWLFESFMRGYYRQQQGPVLFSDNAPASDALHHAQPRSCPATATMSVVGAKLACRTRCASVPGNRYDDQAQRARTSSSHFQFTPTTPTPAPAEPYSYKASVLNTVYVSATLLKKIRESCSNAC